MKAEKDVHFISSTAQVSRFEDSLANLTEANRKLELLMHKPKSQLTAEDRKLIAMTKMLK
jgi:hypothetical protein